MGIFVDCDVCGECDNCEIVDGQYLCGLCWFDYEREKDEEDAICAEDDDYDDL